MLHFSKPVVLASASPRRKQLLEQIGISFTVTQSGIDEILDLSVSPGENVKRISFEKALSVTEQYNSSLIIGADTIVVLDGKIFGKPQSQADAKRMLLELSGKTHIVYTGFTVLEMPQRRSEIAYEATEVTFRTMSESEIESYVATNSPMDKAGAYGIQDDIGAIFIEKINGDFYNVVGLPLCKLYLMLKQFTNNTQSTSHI
ncbi:MAG: septum formation inhibitor Maf [Ignavibacteriales bacterium]|nr:septum formation inhibitor Maf [Ignavibacteriales bacterium]